MNRTTSSPSIGLQVRRGDALQDFEVTLHDRDASLADVLEALGLPDRGVRIDGSPVPEATTVIRALDGLAPGSRIELDADRPEGSMPTSSPAPDDSDSVVELCVVGGVRSGPLARLGPGRYQITQTQGDAANGWSVEIDELPAGQRPERARPWREHGATVETVATPELVVAISAPVDPEPGPAGFVHRPPRSVPGIVVEPVEVAETPAPIAPPAPLSWATMLAPVPVALLMMFFFRPIFALFAAMGPALALGRWYEGRRRFRRSCAERERVIAGLRAELAEALAVQAESLARLRWVEHPHVPELWRRARSSSVRLWERRSLAPGYGCVTVGVGSDRAAPAVRGSAAMSATYADLLHPLVLRPVPHVVDLHEATGIGIHGERVVSLAVARAILLQLATLQGPADLRIGVVCAPGTAAEWDWVKWLPHRDRALTDTDGGLVARQLALRRARPTPFASAKDSVTEAMRVIVIDDPLADVAAVQRTALDAGQRVRFVVVSDELATLPAVCEVLIAGSESGEIELSRTDRPGSTRVYPVGIARSTAVSWARSLASVGDPELVELGAGGPDEVVGLRSLLAIGSAADVVRRWSQRCAADPPVVPLGIGLDGLFTLNLTKDGPHALVAGTTGSGKSELLRSLVVALAVVCPPDHVNFVLVDFKGGGAFDACAALPHVAGLITDLDETVVHRAIQSLSAELTRREAVFRSLGVSSYDAAVVAADEPLPRVVIVIDEFAALATEYRELMAAIVDLAARGRSLGMHLILATQRPSGIVDQKIRANTNCKVVLRVQDAFDSHDMIGTPEAASIDRSSPGRALCAIGGEPAVLVQTAYCGGLDRHRLRCEVRPHRLFPSDRVEVDGVERAVDGGGTELAALVATIIEAGAVRGRRALPVWSEPLPASLDWIDLGARLMETGTTPQRVPLGLVDLPDQQTQQPWFWDIDSGGLIIYGASAEHASKALVAAGAAVTSAAVTSAAGAATHLYLIDGDPGRLTAMAGLSCTGAYVSCGELDRIDRTVHFFASALDERRSERGVAFATSEPLRLVLVIDNIAAVLSAHDDLRAAALVDRLAALARDGTPHRIHLVVSSRTARDVPHRLAQQLPHRLALALADPGGYMMLGLTARDVPPLRGMRAVDVATRRVVQLVEPPDLAERRDAGAAGGSSAAALEPAPIHAFPSKVEVSRLTPAHRAASGLLAVPVGIESQRLGEAILELHPGEHALVIGPPGSGRSTALLTIAHQIGAGVPEIALVRVGPRRSRLAGVGPAGVFASAAADLDRHVDQQRDVVVIVDDADLLDADLAARLDTLVRVRPEHVRLVVATTPDSARGLTSWSARIRAGGTGIVLAGTYGDGDLFRVRLPPVEGLGVVPGRGHVLCRGRCVVAQIARPWPE